MSNFDIFEVSPKTISLLKRLQRFGKKSFVNNAEVGFLLHQLCLITTHDMLFKHSYVIFLHLIIRTYSSRNALFMSP